MRSDSGFNEGEEEASGLERRLEEHEAHHAQEVAGLRRDLDVRFAQLRAEREANAEPKQLLANLAREVARQGIAPAAKQLLGNVASTAGRPRRSVCSPRLVQGLTEARRRLRLAAPRRDRDPMPSTGSVLSPAPSWCTGSAEYVLDRLERVSPPTIVVPIYNAYEDLVDCLDSLIRNTSVQARLLLVDDASTDPRIGPLLAQYELLPGVRVLTNEENLGFVRTVNRVLSESSADVVLLNGDTEVTPRWLENLTLAAYLSSRTATVTPLSNNAGAFSVPVTGEENAVPEALSKDQVGRLVTQSSGALYPGTPSGSGFCIYIKRAMLDELGGFDAESFPRGYGEENDLCMRAAKRGWSHTVDDATLIHHTRMASFAEEKRNLLAAGEEAMDRLHPEYWRLARAFVSSPLVRQVGANVGAAYASATYAGDSVRPRVLFLLHHRGGGTLRTTEDLMDAVVDRYSPYLLISDGARLKLFERTPGNSRLLEEWPLRDSLRVTEFSRPDYRAVAFALLVKYRFELVHVRHLIGHTFDLPEIAARLRVPVVLSFHDFYLSCPTVHLIDDKGVHCGGLCTPGYGQCTLPFAAFRRDLPVLKHAWLETWRDQASRMFRNVDAFVTTSQATQEIYLRSLPSLRDRVFEVIEHGRDLEQEWCAVPPDGGRIPVLVPGDIHLQKGGRFIRALKEADRDARLDFHFLGEVDPEFSDLGVSHGRYAREEFNQRVKEIGPSFIGIFSIWPETYCHTLTEAWGAGVPVLASNIGTLKERVEAHGGGWLIDYEDPESAYQEIVEIADDREAYARELGRANLQGIRSTEEMGADYERLYASLLQERRPFEPRQAGISVGPGTSSVGARQ